jgi:hypothetical protein
LRGLFHGLGAPPKPKGGIATHCIAVTRGGEDRARLAPPPIVLRGHVRVVPTGSDDSFSSAQRNSSFCDGLLLCFAVRSFVVVSLI